MKNIFRITAVLFHFIAAVCCAASPETNLFRKEAETHLFVNNRIMATVNNKRISVIDVMKKMDVQFYRHYPEYTNSVVARYQYYKVNWKHVLQDLIDKELIIADASENKLPITNGEVRQELEKTFGPNIIANLDKAGLTFEEAWKIMLEEITIRRMIQYKANAKVLRKLTPHDIRASYEEYIKTTQLPEEWEYIVITIRDPDATQGSKVATFIHSLVNEQKTPLEDLSAKMTAEFPENTTSKLTISEPFHHGEKELSAAYKEALAKLTPGEYSAPFEQKSRADKSTVFRIFHLKEHNPGGTPPFNTVSNDLRDKLADQLFEQETNAYLKKLRTHYHVDDSELQNLISDGFEPFILR